jgi:GNAT superfamily N-acetyltransferase
VTAGNVATLIKTPQLQLALNTESCFAQLIQEKKEVADLYSQLFVMYNTKNATTLSQRDESYVQSFYNMKTRRVFSTDKWHVWAFIRRRIIIGHASVFDDELVGKVEGDNKDIEIVWVTPGHTKKGIGKRMVKFALLNIQSKWFKEKQGYATIQVATAPDVARGACSCYVNAGLELGFRVTVQTATGTTMVTSAEQKCTKLFDGWIIYHWK